MEPEDLRWKKAHIETGYALRRDPEKEVCIQTDWECTQWEHPINFRIYPVFIHMSPQGSPNSRPYKLFPFTLCVSRYHPSVGFRTSYATS